MCVLVCLNLKRSLCVCVSVCAGFAILKLLLLDLHATQFTCPSAGGTLRLDLTLCRHPAMFVVYFSPLYICFLNRNSDFAIFSKFY